MTEASLAYAAGFFDGEGSIGINRSLRAGCKGPIYQLRTQVAQDDPRPLIWLAETWGGVAKARPTPRPTRVAHRWTLHSRMAAQFLTDVLPYLMVKKEQALLAVAFQASRTNPGIYGLTLEERAFFQETKEAIERLNRMERA